MNSLSGNIVVIIGGSSGMGLETARQAHAAGAKLILTGRDQQGLDAVRDELGASVSTLDLNDPARRQVIAAIMAAALPAIVANAAVELAPVRVNTLAAGFVDTPLAARVLGDDLERRRAELRATLPIRRVVGPADVAALAITLMTNSALTGGTYDVDGGQQLIA
jgi:NAD(P)-dependent dehydrogenase (short-subunit alcohol dehydrogenase family)